MFRGQLAPWLGLVRPLILRGPIRAPGVNGPDALTSTAYTADFDEVKRLGSATSSERTPEQTDTARFFNAGAAIMVSVGLLDYLEKWPRLPDRSGGPGHPPDAG